MIELIIVGYEYSELVNVDSYNVGNELRIKMKVNT
jgi:hypothetical protein